MRIHHNPHDDIDGAEAEGTTWIWFRKGRMCGDGLLLSGAVSKM
jgi:hypothetical protein